MNNTIYLSFLELETQNLSFKIYRKEADEKGDNRELLFGQLPIDPQAPDESDWRNYLVSLQKINDEFEEFNYRLWINPHLSNRIIFQSLCNAINKSNIGLSFEINTKRYLHTIDFIIDKVTEGRKLVYLSAFYLKNENKFGFLIDYKFSLNEDVTFSKETQKHSLSLDARYRSNRNFYKDKFQLIQQVIPQLPPITLGEVTVKIAKNLLSLNSQSLSNKVYFFGGGNKGNSQFSGIKKYGAYHTLNPESSIKFYFIFKDKHRNLANDIFLSLTGKKSPGTFSGMKSMFDVQITKENVTRIILQDSSINKAKEALGLLETEIENNTDGIQPFVLYIEDNNHEDIQKEIYHFFKYELLRKEIALQVVTHEKLSNQDTLKWSISSIGLQIFSKLGGVPWIVKPSKENCLILGIGQSYEISAEGTEKQFAYSVCVDSSGIFKRVSILSSENENEGEDFYKEIEKNIVSLLKEDEFKNYDKCAIHVPFKIRKEVMVSIKNAASKISREIQVKVIKVNTKNKFFGYGSHHTKVPYESSYIYLGKGEYLVWFEGLNYGKENVYKRPGNPIHIEFLNFEGNHFKDELEYLQDVLNLSGGNWRGFNAKSMPISIYYSQIIADYTQEFEKIEGFDKSVFINQKPWFL